MIYTGTITDYLMPTHDPRDSISGQPDKDPVPWLSEPIVKPWHTHVGMSDQEIRARALECAVRGMDHVKREPLGGGCGEDETFWNMTSQFEDYIRNGNAS